MTNINVLKPIKHTSPCTPYNKTLPTWGLNLLSKYWKTRHTSFHAMSGSQEKLTATSPRTFPNLEGLLPPRKADTDTEYTCNCAKIFQCSVSDFTVGNKETKNRLSAYKWKHNMGDEQKLLLATSNTAKRKMKQHLWHCTRDMCTYKEKPEQAIHCKRDCNITSHRPDWASLLFVLYTWPCLNRSTCIIFVSSNLQMNPVKWTSSIFQTSQ